MPTGPQGQEQSDASAVEESARAQAWTRIPADLHRRASALSRSMMRVKPEHVPEDEDSNLEPETPS